MATIIVDGIERDETPEEEAERLALFAPVAPTEDDYKSAITAMMDDQAKSRRYDSGLSLSTYVTSTIPAWAAEAQAFVDWRDAVWAYAYAELAKVQAGERVQPSVADFLTELPQLVWPD